MGWDKREAVTDLVILGDGEGNRKKVGGLLVGVRTDSAYPDRNNYELVQQDGEVLTLAGSASLGRQISDRDIGKFVKCAFTGWGKSPNGKFKAIDVNVWEGDPTPEMKAWPRFAEFQKANGKPPVATKKAIETDVEFQGALDEEDDDLPF